MKATQATASCQYSFTMTFIGFSESDFDAYLKRKWASNVFNLERLQVKQKLESLGNQLAPNLLSADGSPLACAVSTEHPALWNQRKVDNQQLFFARNAEAREELSSIITKSRTMASLIEDPSPLRNHIFLGVQLCVSGLTIALRVHRDASVDRENFQRKVDDFLAREHVLAALVKLGSAFSIGLSGESKIAADSLTDEALQRLSSALRTHDGWFEATHAIERSDAITQGPGVAESVAELLKQLLPPLRQIAWSRTNDFISVNETLREKKEIKKTKGIQKNDTVRVIRGMFSGKRGTVQDVDTKGGLKVLLGKMTVKLTPEDVMTI